MMNFLDFVNRVVDDGIAAARADYIKPEERKKLDGSIAGFELCRGKLADQLQIELSSAEKIAGQKAMEHAEDYWYWRCRAAEVEWVCNVVSAARVNIGLLPLASHMPTARAVMKAAEILGVKGETDES